MSEDHDTCSISLGSCGSEEFAGKGVSHAAHRFEQVCRPGVISQKGEDGSSEVVVKQVILVADREELSVPRGPSRKFPLSASSSLRNDEVKKGGKEVRRRSHAPTCRHR